MIAFWLLVIIGMIAIFFLASFLYKPIGNYIFKIGKDAVDNMKDENKKEEHNNE